MWRQKSLRVKFAVGLSSRSPINRLGMVGTTPRLRGMSKTPFGSPAITVPRRALIIQRVLVDGWTSAKVAATFDVSERQVDAWVADYRRRGMTSLRHGAGWPPIAKVMPLTVARPVREAARRLANGLRRLLAGKPPPQPLLLLRRAKDDRIGGK